MRTNRTYSLMAALTIAMTLCALPALAQIEINDIDELQLIGNDPGYPLDGDYILGNDIDASATATWNSGAGFNPIGIFAGSFDGAGYVITGLTINRPDTADYVGLFGYTNGATLQNIALEDIDITGHWHAGGLVGLNFRGSITNCYSTGTVWGNESVGGLVGENYDSSGSITNCYSTGAVGGRSYIGGLVGDNNGGSITTCYSTGEVWGNGSVGGLVGHNGGSITTCYSTGKVWGDEHVGGLVGHNAGSITSSYGTGAVAGDSVVGGLVGDNYYGSSITSSYSTSAVRGSGTNAGSGNDVGGLVGNNHGSITSSYSTGTVKNRYYWVGGLVGSNSGDITSSYSTGTVLGNGSVGGLVGRNVGGSITTCYSTGAVTGDEYVGGLVGNNGDGSITDCYWDTETSGQTISDGGTGKTTAEMMSQATFTGWDFTSIWSICEGVYYPYLQGIPNHSIMVSIEAMETPTTLPVTFNVTFAAPVVTGFDNADVDFSLSSMSVTAYTVTTTGNNQHYTVEVTAADGVGFVVLSLPENICVAECSSNLANMSATSNAAYIWIEINDIDELQIIGNDSAYPLDGAYRLSNDIDAGDTANWNSGKGFAPLGDYTKPFTGTFDGAGHIITGLTINRSSTSYVGLFGRTNGATLQNIILENVDIIGNNEVGGLVGWNGGNITNCYSTGTVTGDDLVGGLVGYNDDYSSIINCYSTGAVTGYSRAGGLVGVNDDYSSIINCYSTGAVTGDSYVGGLVGTNSGNITNCYSNGAVTGVSYVGGLVGANIGSITNCYSAGAVSGDDLIGGLVGYNGDGYGSITDCYWDTETSGQTISDGGTGKTTAEMMSQATFAGWDFTETWSITEGATYPWLQGLKPAEGEGEGESEEGEGEDEPNIDDILDNFDELDTNGDGVLSADELSSVLTNEQFTALDTNADGVLDIYELGAEVAEGEGESDEGESTEGESDEGESVIDEIAENLLEQFESADADNDGVLSYDEVQTVMPELTREQFDALDTDGDGFLSRAELQGEDEEETGCAGCAGCNTGKLNAEGLPKLLGDWLLIGLTLLVITNWRLKSP